MIKNDREAVRREQVRQLFLVQVSEKQRTEAGVVGFYRWMEEHRQGLLVRGKSDPYVPPPIRSCRAVQTKLIRRTFLSPRLAPQYVPVSPRLSQ